MTDESQVLTENFGIPWHTLEESEVAEKLEATLGGLSEEEARGRIARYGENILPVKEPPTIVAIFLRQFRSPLIYILVIAGIVSLFFEDVTDATFIFLVVFINAFIGTVQESKAEKSAASLQKMLKVYARARRDGSERQIPSEALVPGDIVLLESGSRIPADLRLLRTQNLAVDESLLTGESYATEKSPGILDPATPVSDRMNMAFAGSTVMSGRGTGIIVATGSFTEIGRIAATVAGADIGKPPLIIRMEEFSRKISIAVLASAALLAMIVLTRGMPPVEVFFLAIALAVSAIPEGLPVAVTVALSIATSRMAKRHVIVRQLAAVESLGSCTVIASDKTGTLTVNQQTVRQILLPDGEEFTVSGVGYVGEGGVAGSEDSPSRMRLDRLARAAILCNEGSLVREEAGWVHSGDAMDVALLAFGYKLGLDPGALKDRTPPVAELPFESERRYSAAWCSIGDEIRAVVKGAIETVLPFCQTMATRQGSAPIDRSHIEAQLQDLSGRGYRVLAIAESIREDIPRGGKVLNVPPLELLGLVGFIDPTRPDVPDAIARSRQAGVDVVMVTGDHPETAFAIARELQITDSRDEVTTGAELEEIGPPTLPQFLSKVRATRVFARVTPLQKLHIVEGLRASGHFVAVTGDGVNDAPALRTANIGVAMGSGTEVAKDAASMIVTDDNFSSIVGGIEEGRYAYDNVRKVTYLLISTGFAEVVLFIVAVAIALPLPLLAVQLLWLNLVTNGIQGVALAFEKGEPGAMSRPPRRPEEGIFNDLMVKQTIISGLVIGLIAFGTWRYLLGSGWAETDARNLVVLLMVLLENFHVFNCRSEYRSLFRVPLRNNLLLIGGVIGAQGIHILSMYIPFFQETLQIAPVTITQWASLLLLASSVLIVMEVFKFVQGARRSAPTREATGRA